MTLTLLAFLLAAPAAANPAAMKASLDALRSEIAAGPAARAAQERASSLAGRSFDGNLTVQTLTPVELASLDGAPRLNPPPQSSESPGAGADYYFEGKKPLNGITIYTPVKGEGSTAQGDSPTEKYGKYGKYAMIAGLGLGAAGLALGGTPLVVLALAAGLLIGAGAVLSFLFGKKKK